MKFGQLVPLQNIRITKTGKPVVRPAKTDVSAVDAISGILKGKVSDSIDRDSLRDGRMSRYEIAFGVNKSP